MPRETKFRGWHTKLNRMISAEELAADQLTLLTTGEFINVHGSSTELSEVFPREKFVPLQYTGLKDKNGVEIYEGDIAEYISAQPVRSMPWIGEVMWQDFRGCWAIGKSHAYNNDLFRYVRNGGQCKVIGNIYENPELLA